MKIYLVYLALAISSIFGVAIPVRLAVAQPSTVVPKGKVISPVAALNRLIVAKKLEASWFTPEFLKAVDKNSDVNAIQFQRDVTMKLGKLRYGNYKSIQPIGGDKYRIIFDRAEPDAVIVKFNLDARGRIANVSISEKNKPAPTAQAQLSAQAALDKSFKTNVRVNGENSPILPSLKQWLGNYQKMQKVDANNYLGIFARGSVPINVIFKPDGSIESYGMNCPTTKVSLKQAPANLQQMLSKCPNLK
jgi:hypothetical protein